MALPPSGAATDAPVQNNKEAASKVYSCSWVDFDCIPAASVGGRGAGSTKIQSSICSKKITVGLKEEREKSLCIDLNEMSRVTRCIFEHLLNSGLMWADQPAGAEDEGED